MTKPISDPLTSGLEKPVTAKSSVKEPNYTKRQEAEMQALYVPNPCRDTVNEIAKIFGKTERSVIAKLSNMKIYVTPKRTTKTGTPIIKKSTLVEKIGKQLEIDVPSLEKANKQDLEKLLKALHEWLGEEETE